MKKTKAFNKDLKRIQRLAFNVQNDGKALADISDYLIDKRLTHYHYDIVDTLPNFIPPRKLYYHEGVLYRGALESDTSPLGTPISLVGFHEQKSYIVNEVNGEYETRPPVQESGTIVWFGQTDATQHSDFVEYDPVLGIGDIWIEVKL